MEKCQSRNERFIALEGSDTRRVPKRRYYARKRTGDITRTGQHIPQNELGRRVVTEAADNNGTDFIQTASSRPSRHLRVLPRLEDAELRSVVLSNGVKDYRPRWHIHAHRFSFCDIGERRGEEG